MLLFFNRMHHTHVHKWFDWLLSICELKPQLFCQYFELYTCYWLVDGQSQLYINCKAKLNNVFVDNKQLHMTTGTSSIQPLLLAVGKLGNFFF